MERKRLNLERLRARLAQWYTFDLYANQLLGAVTRREFEVALSQIDLQAPCGPYFLRCGSCGSEDLATGGEAILFWQVGDPTFLCTSCSEEYDACSGRMLREHLTAPAHLRSAWARIRANAGRGVLTVPQKRLPRTGDPVRN